MASHLKGSFAAHEENAIEEELARLYAVLDKPDTPQDVVERARKTIERLESGESFEYRMNRNAKKPWAKKGDKK